MALGTIKWFDIEGGYGLISPDDGGRNLFTRNTRRSTAGEGLESLAKGDKVTYEVHQGRNGPRAVSVSKEQLRYYRRGSPGRKPRHDSNMSQEEEDGAELLNRLYRAQTEEQIDDTAAAAERWLVERPHDEDVRLAREQAMRRRAGAPPH